MPGDPLTMGLYLLCGPCLPLPKDAASHHKPTVSWPACQLEPEGGKGGDHVAVSSTTCARPALPRPLCKGPCHRLLPGQLLLRVSLQLPILVNPWGSMGHLPLALILSSIVDSDIHTQPLGRAEARTGWTRVTGHYEPKISPLLLWSL